MMRHPPSAPSRLRAFLPAFVPSAVPLAIAILIAILCVRCGPATDDVRLRVFVADSLARPFAALNAAFEAEHPDVEVVQIASGSVLAARRLTDGNDEADVLAVADYAVIDRLLRPDHADWSICFATNEIVIIYSDMSRGASELDVSNWYEVLTRPDVHVKAANPHHDPCGYWTELAWRLADLYYPRSAGGGTIHQRLGAACGPASDRRTDAQQLIRLVESAGGVDYAFVYLSQARQHNLRHLRLPPAVSLGAIGHVDTYRRVSIVLPGDDPSRPHEKQGDAIVFALTIPRSARHPSRAADYVAFLLGPGGRALLQREHMVLVERPWTYDLQRVPPPLRPLVSGRDREASP